MKFQQLQLLNKLGEDVPKLLLRIEELEAKVRKLEAKPKRGRPPKAKD